jgi:hypothetical protein
MCRASVAPLQQSTLTYRASSHYAAAFGSIGGDGGGNFSISEMIMRYFQLALVLVSAETEDYDDFEAVKMREK